MVCDIACLVCRSSSGCTVASNCSKVSSRSLGCPKIVRHRADVVSRFALSSSSHEPNRPASSAACRRRSPSASSLRRARASYCRRRPFMAVRATLTNVVAWNGLSKKVTLPRISDSRAAAGFFSGPPPLCVSTMNGRSDQLGWHAIQLDKSFRSLERTVSSVKMPNATLSPRFAAKLERSWDDRQGISAAARRDEATSASRPLGANISAAERRSGIAQPSRSRWH